MSTKYTTISTRINLHTEDDIVGYLEDKNTSEKLKKAVRFYIKYKDVIYEFSSGKQNDNNNNELVVDELKNITKSLEPIGRLDDVYKALMDLNNTIKNTSINLTVDNNVSSYQPTEKDEMLNEEFRENFFEAFEFQKS